MLIVSNPNGSDARIIDGGGFGGASQPVWSPDGQTLGWVSFTEEDILITELAIESDTKNESSIGSTFPFYLQWNSAGDTLGYVRPSAFGGPGLELATIVPGERPSVVAEGSPIYFSFAPDDDSILGHIDASRLAIWGDSPTIDLEPTSGTFSAPAWLDQDRVLAHLDDKLTIVSVDDGRTTDVADVGRATEFVVNPNSELVAYLGGAPELMEIQANNQSATSLRVLELDTGFELVVTEEPVAAFEWSPDGSKLAWLEMPQGPAVGGARWHFWSGGEIAVSAEYVPTQMVSEQYLPFFAQFAQSHSRWSADGEGFAFAGRIGADDGIWVQVMDPTVDPVLVGFGSMVIWSPNPEGSARQSPA